MRIERRKLDYEAVLDELDQWYGVVIDQIDSAVGTDSRRNKTKQGQKLRSAWVAEALILRQENPNMSRVQIAQLVGVHPGQLSRCSELAALENMIKGKVRAGNTVTDPETKLRDVTAHSTGDKADRGSTISGSALFREYCADCEEAIRVQQDQVGKSPRCEACTG